MFQPPNLPPGFQPSGKQFTPADLVPIFKGTVEEQAEKYLKELSDIEAKMQFAREQLQNAINDARTYLPNAQEMTDDQIANEDFKTLLNRIRNFERKKNAIRDKLAQLGYISNLFNPKLTGSGRKRKLTGKGINNPWIEFVKKNRGRFSSLKELSVLYHSKRK
jgi:uncharacterized protein YdbL (DUF1318 family)